ncbi:MAG: ATP-dependent DNA helicase [Candidatus Methanomethylicia archaeon]
MKIEYDKYFPYREYRDGQIELIEKVMDTILNGENIILRAPSGFGKTITVLTAIIPILEKLEDNRVIWLCRTHRENNRVIEEIKKIKNIPNTINAITLEARTKMCIKSLDKDLKKDHEAFSILCSELRRQRRCEYYDKKKIEGIEIPQVCGVKELIEICEKNNVCPYEVAKREASIRRILIANYNYMLIPQIMKTLNLKLKNSILIVDEAHNLPEIAVNMEMEKITIRGLEETIIEMEREDLIQEIEIIEQLMKIIVKESNVEVVIEKDRLKRAIEEVCGNLSDIALKLITEGDRIRHRLAKEGKKPISHIHHLGKFLKKFQSIVEKEEYAVFSGNSEMWIECFDPSNILRKIYGTFNATISMSGTIDEKYGELIGIQKYKYVKTTYTNSKNILPIIVENVSTDYEERSLEMYQKINEYIFILSENTKMGIGVFTASYKVLEGLIEAGIKKLMKPIYIEEQNEDPRTSEWKIEAYKEKARNEGAIYLGVCGGRASEGEDFPGREMDIVLLVGIPFPEPSIRIDKKNEYYEKRFGEKGKLYSYILPAIWKASQAAGRAIRGHEDKGIVVYLDRRYKRYIDLLPEWLKPRKIIKEPEQLKEEVIFFFTP